MATKTHEPNTHVDAPLLVDVDLSILGQPKARFDEYERQIRAEYGWVPEKIFGTKRAEILQRFAHAMGWQKRFDYATPADIFAEHAALTRGTDIDIAPLRHAHLKQQGTIQWPIKSATPYSSSQQGKDSDNCPKSEHPTGSEQVSESESEELIGTARLYENHHFPTPSGRAQLKAVQYEDRSEPLSDDFPLGLTTGRIRDHWHTMTKTGSVNRLSSHIDSPFCEIHPHDAHTRGIRDGDIISIRNPRGEVRVRAAVTEDILAGVVFLPMHWGKRLTSDTHARGRANNLTSPRYDPVSKEPDLKMAAVEVSLHVPPRRRIVIIGAGTAALAFIEAHRQFNTRDEMLLLGGESLPVYNRILLPHYIEAAGSDDSWQTLVRADGDSLVPHRVIFHANTLVSRVDRSSKTIFDCTTCKLPSSATLPLRACVTEMVLLPTDDRHVRDKARAIEALTTPMA